MKTHKQISSVLILIACLLPLTLSGCKKELQIGQERIVESSDKRAPKWVSQPPKKTRKYYYFVGEDTSYKNTDRYAYQVALSKAGSFFNTRATSTFKRVENSTNAFEANVLREEFIKNTSEAGIKGALHKDTYWEKVEKLTENGIKYFYRVYVLIALDRKSIKATEEATLQLQEEKAQTAELKASLKAIRNEIREAYNKEENN